MEFYYVITSKGGLSWSPFFFLCDEGPSLDLAFYMATVHQLFIFRFVSQHCLPTQHTTFVKLIVSVLLLR